MRTGWHVILLVAVSFLASCRETTKRSPSLPRPLARVSHPPGNPPTRAKIALGRALFFDPRLSRDDTVACATCHDPAARFSDGKALAVGINGATGTRSTPSLVNVGYTRPFFWDGRVETLEEQALIPIQHPREMGSDLGVLEAKIDSIEAYRRQFAAVFGGEVTAQRIALSIAAFERTIIVRNTPFDRYLEGDDDALSAVAKRGMELFLGQARCSKCHEGARLTDREFHNVGAIAIDRPADPGRRAVTGRRVDEGAFKTPALRDVALTAPYMHNGMFATLEEVVEHYNFGGVTDLENEFRDSLLEVLYMSEDQVEDLVTFLKEGLTSPANEQATDR
jgi:cytochrome c peroxidase